MGHVAGHKNGAPLEGRDLIRDFRKPLFTPRQQDKIDAVPREFNRQCPPNAARRAGH
jgi:hypothetical protein